MKPRTLMRMLPSAVAAATVFCAATANASHDPRYRHGAQCIDQATNRITLPCNDDSTDPIHFTREQAQAWVARKKKEKADAAKAATDAAIAANRCGTGQVLVGGSCQDFKAAIDNERGLECARDQVLSGGTCVPLNCPVGYTLVYRQTGYTGQMAECQKTWDSWTKLFAGVTWWAIDSSTGSYSGQVYFTINSDGSVDFEDRQDTNRRRYYYQSGAPQGMAPVYECHSGIGVSSECAGVVLTPVFSANETATGSPPSHFKGCIGSSCTTFPQ